MTFSQFFHRLAASRSRRLNDQGLLLWARGELPDAESLLRAAIHKNPANAAAISNLGALLMALHRYDEGMGLLQQAAVVNGQDPGILVNLGNAYHLGSQPELAINCYRQALAHEPENVQANLNILRPLLEVCDWGGVAQRLAFIRERFVIDSVKAFNLITPFNAIFLPFSRSEIHAIAALYAAANHAIDERQRPSAIKLNTDGHRIKVAYLSSDFHDHPTAHLTLGIYERHDRKRFEIYAYSIGRPDSGAYRSKISKAVDHFKDVHLRSDREIATEIKADGIDILMDMKGYTGGSRSGILALRPAPIQVNYLGYPGTMGADFIDFLIADPITIPADHEPDYSEQIVRLPHTYQSTDNCQEIDAVPVDRASAGLPADAFVFCCLNVSAKIDKASFSAWMKILLAVPQSVIWLLDTSASAQANLAKAAHEQGLDPRRILYAKIVPKALHLARLRLADLMLDTFICNAHTTATDALWAGVPLVTKTGETFASRVATSLLHAVGLPQLAVNTEAEYIHLAVEIAQDPARLQILRDSLKDRLHTPLFDTAAYVADLDRVLLSMYRQKAR